MSVEQLITQHIDTWTSALRTRSTAGRGSNGKIDLYGIKKLRELILELAVRGKLVPQAPNDEPASELLKRITAEKTQLVKEGKIKKPKSLPEITEEEKPYELPEGWEWTRLIELGIWALGSGFPNAIQGINNEEILLCKVSDMNLEGNERFITHTNNTISVETAEKYKITISTPGTVIFPKIGGAIATNKRRIIKKRTAIDNNCLGIKPSGAINLDWFYLILSSIDMAQYQSGTSVPAINQSTIGNIPVGLPPEKMQLRIFEKVKELMSILAQLEYKFSASLDAHQQLVEALLATLTDSKNADELAENWARMSEQFDTLFTTEASIDALKQTILQLAVMGKLVPQDPNDEPASELLKRIEQEKMQLVKEGKIKKQKPLPPLTDKEKSFELPKGWEWCRLGDCIHLISGQHLKPDEYTEDKADGLIPYITGPAEFGEVSPIISKYTMKRRAVAEPNDILLTCKGAGLGKLNTADSEIAISRQLMAIRPIGVNQHYFRLLLLSMYDYFQSKGIGIAIPGISREDVIEPIISLPPLEEQIAIVDFTTSMYGIIKHLKSRLQSAQQTQLHLADALTDAALS